MKLLPAIPAALLALACVVRSTDARADESAPPPPPPARYGAQTLAADGAGLAILASGILAGNGTQSGTTVGNVLTATGLASYALATPILHAVHARWDMAGLSLAMRVVGVPLVGLLGAAVGFAGWHDASPMDQLGFSAFRGLFIGGAVGLGVGAVAVPIIDAAVLAREKRAPANPSAPPKASVRVVPSIDPSHRAGGVGVLGSF
jgi:hypothetical protein